MVLFIVSLSEKGRIIKNLISFGVVYLILFAAVNTTIGLESVINQIEALGMKLCKILFKYLLFTFSIISVFKEC